MKMTSTLLLGASMAALAAASAHADDLAQGAAAPAAGTNAIEEVVVTAQKVETNLQKTPLAVTAVSGSALDQRHIVAPMDLDTLVPGMVVNTTPSNPLSISIRGAGYEGIENTSAQRGSPTTRTASISPARSR